MNQDVATRFSTGLKGYLTLREAADYLGLSTSFVYRATGAGEIQHLRAGRKILFTRQMLDEFLTLQTKER